MDNDQAGKKIIASRPNGKSGDIWDPSDLAKCADEMKEIAGKVNAPYMPGTPGSKAK